MFATMFDLLADSYDQSGVPFFATIAEGLVRRLEPAAGERALEELRARPELRPADLSDVLDPQSRLVLCRRLVREGLLEILHP